MCSFKGLNPSLAFSFSPLLEKGKERRKIALPRSGADNMAKTTNKQSKNSTKNIPLKVKQLSSNEKIEPDVSNNTTWSQSMDVDSMATTTMGKQSKNSTKNAPVKASQPATNIKSEPEISGYGIWSPYLDGIVGMPKSVAEIISTDAVISAVLYGLRHTRRLPIFKRICA